MSMRKSMFIEGSNFYKGNVHGHTVISDGELQVEESIRAYKERGYSFIVISDHETYFDSTAYDSEDFIVHPGIEWAIEEPKDGHKGHHIHGILGTKEMVEAAGDKRIPHGTYLDKYDWKTPQTIQRAIDTLRDAGNLVMYNHPIWSRLELDDLLNVRGYFALEIYNWNCEVWDATGLATHYWDMLLRRGLKVYGIASDDNHNNFPFGSASSDSFGGWIVVAAKKLDRESLAEALVQGSFYASNGPEIYEYVHDGDEVYIKCSPVKRINFITYERRGTTKLAEDGEYITEATFKLAGDEIFARLECVDEFGKTAWSNPLFLQS